ncbi:DNA-directed RNA polymerase subunit delta [Tepidibacillus sp. LV47]|uniref:DNA-directed RNA polymerase subunit delta n=1 Tax=Tepidibacillus sp. LV47 TaxID=3398228 RepID=UPI003AAA7DBE
MAETAFTFDKRNIQEKPMVDLAYEILKQTKHTLTYQELADEVFKLKGLPEEDRFDFIVQLYTEINIDGRFVSLGQNEWGLKQWYPVDQLESVHLRFNDDDDEDEDTDYEYDEEVDDEELTDEDEFIDDELEDEYDDTDIDDDFIDDDVNEFEADEDEDLDLD